MGGNLRTGLGEVSASAPGTGNITLNGALTLHRAFDDASSRIVHPATSVPIKIRIELASDATTYEICDALYSKSGATKTIVRGQVYESSVANAAVNFAGLVNVFTVVNADDFGPLTGSRLGDLTGGTSTAYTLAISPAPPALVDRMLFLVEIHTTSGAAPTLSVNGGTARNIVDNSGTNLAAGALIGNSTVLLRYRASGTKFWVVGGFSGGTVPTTVTMGTGAQVLLDPSVTLPGATIPLAFGGDPNTGVVRTAADTMGLVAGGSTIVTITTTAISVAGNVNASGDLAVNGNIYADADTDSNWSMTKSGGNPLLVMDSGDYFGLDRASNVFLWSIGSSNKLTLSGTVLLTTAVTINAGAIALQSGATLTAPNGTVIVGTNDLVGLRVFTVATLPSAAANQWKIAFASDSGTSKLVYSNASAWFASGPGAGGGGGDPPGP